MTFKQDAPVRGHPEPKYATWHEFSDAMRREADDHRPEVDAKRNIVQFVE